MNKRTKTVLHDSLGPRLKAALGRLAERLSFGVEDLPADLEACECFCRATDCSRGHWERCERRLRLMKIRRAFENRRSGSFPTAVGQVVEDRQPTNKSAAFRKAG